MSLLFCDLETYSEVPINHGTWAYAEGAEVILWAYALDDGPVECWDVANGEPPPLDLLAALADSEVMTVWHNGGNFDSTVLRFALPDLCPPTARIHDTMIQGMSVSLPGALGKVGEILGTPEDLTKDKEGRALIQLFCKPRPKKQKLRRATRETHPDEWDAFIRYAKADIEAMRWNYKHLPTWNYKGAERALWELDQRINARGVYIDRHLAEAALAAADRLGAMLDAECLDLTDEAVTSTKKRNVLLEYIQQRYDLPELEDLKSSTVETLLEKVDLPEDLIALLTNRLAATKTSTAKYKRLLQAINSDGFLRGLLQFVGALRTGRWAGRTFQPQNLPRVPKYIAKEWELAIEAIKYGALEYIYEKPMEVLSACLRGVIIAPPGMKLCVADWSNIEGRGLAWLAGEDWKLAAFRDFDLGLGEDLYKLAYAKAFKVSVETVDDALRQIGKVLELSMGYQGGVGAFVTFAIAYGIDLDELAATAADTIPEDVMAEAQNFLDWLYSKAEKAYVDRVENKGWDIDAAGDLLLEEKTDARLGLAENTWLVCDSLKRLWRRAHPATVDLWAQVEKCARLAIRTPGENFRYRDLVFRRDGNWLRIRLPSGRFLCYPGVICNEEGDISYMGVHQLNRKWRRIKTYGGKLVENINQGMARDIMGYHMPRVEAAGYEIVLTVHDEPITYAPDTPEYGYSKLAAIMSETPPWAPGLPLAADGFDGYRYRK